MSEILLAAEIAFRCLHGCMPQQELNLLKLSAVRVAQLPVPSEVKKIVHRMSEILFAAEIAFRRLDGCMPQ